MQKNKIAPNKKKITGKNIMNQQHSDFTRRDFMKRTALSAGSVMVLTRGLSLGTENGDPASGPSKEWTKRITKCKKVIAHRTGSNAYTQAELNNIDSNFRSPPANPFPEPPEGPPTGSNKISGPDEVAWRTTEENLGVVSNYRDPQPPTISSHYDAASGETWAVYFYDYVEERYEYNSDEP